MRLWKCTRRWVMKMFFKNDVWSCYFDHDTLCTWCNQVQEVSGSSIARKLTIYCQSAPWWFSSLQICIWWIYHLWNLVSLFIKSVDKTDTCACAAAAGPYQNCMSTHLSIVSVCVCAVLKIVLTWALMHLTEPRISVLEPWIHFQFLFFKAAHCNICFLT